MAISNARATKGPRYHENERCLCPAARARRNLRLAVALACDSPLPSGRSNRRAANMRGAVLQGCFGDHEAAWRMRVFGDSQQIAHLKHNGLATDCRCSLRERAIGSMRQSWHRSRRCVEDRARCRVVAMSWVAQALWHVLHTQSYVRSLSFDQRAARRPASEWW